MVSRRLQKKTFSKVRRSPDQSRRPAPAGPRLISQRFSRTLSWEWLGYLLAAWALVMVGLFSLPNYNQLLPPNPLTRLPTLWVLLIGVAILTYLWRQVPLAPENTGDWSPLTSRVLFWSLCAVGVAWRMQNADRPMGYFWDDHYVVLKDIRAILDYRERPLLFPFGWREPLFPYLTAFLWHFSPSSTGIFMANLSSTVLEAAIFWISYLIGKEIGGRRMGILFLAMEIISKPMIMICKVGFGNETTTLGCALALLFFLRILRKPNLRHFTQWGLALAFGATCYVPFRPWTPVMLGAGLVWVLSDAKERNLGFFRAVIGPGLLAVWAFLFLYKNSFLPAENGLVKLLTEPVALAVVAALLASGYLRIALSEYRANRKGKGTTKLFGWATGALVTALAMSPFYLHPDYSAHVSDLSVFSSLHSHTLGDGFRALWNNIAFCMRLMFGQENDIGRVPSVGDSLFDFYVAAAGLLAFAYFLARPSWLKAYLVLLYIVGVTPDVFSHEPHTLRLVSAIIPLLLAGAWGLNRLWVAFLQTRDPRTARVVCAALFVLGGTWEAGKNYQLIQTWLGEKSPDLTIADEVQKELPGHRVYLVRHHPGFWTFSQTALSDGKTVYVMGDSNFIDLTPGEQGKDLAILAAGEDKEGQQKVEKAFPGLPWSGRFLYYQKPGEVPFIQLMEVPFNRIPEGPTGLFHIRHVASTTWLRRCYGNYGIGRGLIYQEERVVHWNEDLPTGEVEWYNSVRLEGTWTVKIPGEYGLRVQSGNAMWLLVDGRKVLEIKAKEGFRDKNCKVSLEKGPHSIELVVGFTYDHQVPPLLVTLPGSSSEVSLEDLQAGAGGS